MAEWLRAPWKDTMSLGIEETNQVFYEFPVMLSNKVPGRRHGNIWYLFQNGSCKLFGFGIASWYSI